MKNLLFFAASFSFAAFSLHAGDVLWELSPGDRDYIAADHRQRGIAFNPETGHVLLAVNDRDNTTISLQVLDAQTGADLGQMSVAGMEGGTFTLNMIAVADDGTIYGTNLTSNSTTTPFRLYRWANEQADPELVFEGDPSEEAEGPGNRRFGDTISLRGTGEETQILLGTLGTIVTIMTPSGSGFTSTRIDTDAMGRDFEMGISFGRDDTFFGKATVGSGLRKLSFDLLQGTATTVALYDQNVFPWNIGPIRVVLERGLLAGIVVGDANASQHVVQYGLDELSETMPAASRDITTYAARNRNIAGWGSLTYAEGTIFALNTNNGILAVRASGEARPLAIEEMSTPEPGRLELAVRSRLPVDSVRHVLEGSPNLVDWAEETDAETLAALGGGTARFSITLPASDRYFYRFVGHAAPPLFFEDFETGGAGWTSGGANNTWQFGAPTSGPGKAVSEPNVAATNLAGHYEEDTNAWLRSPAIDLGGVSSATLTFWEYTDVYEDLLYHGTVVSVLDASTLDQIAILAEYADKTPDWRRRTFSLPSEALDREIVLQFRLYGDHLDMADGWYLDDIAITALAPLQLENTATLSGIAINQEPISSFHPSNMGYDVDVAGWSETTAAIAATPTDASALILIDGEPRAAGQPFVVDLSEGGFPIHVGLDVLARDGITSRSYTVTFFDSSNLINVALNKPVLPSTDRPANPASYAVDGIVSNASRWLTEAGAPAPQWLEIELLAHYELVRATIWTGAPDSVSNFAVDHFKLQSWNGSDWVDIPGGEVVNNTSEEVHFTFDEAVTTNRVRWFSSNSGVLRIAEIMIFAVAD